VRGFQVNWTDARKSKIEEAKGTAVSWDETCSRCGNSLLWWRSRSGYRVCMVCCPDPLAALETLARRGAPGLVMQVQRWQLRAEIKEGDEHVPDVLLA
jgi:hypothetical protein